jgi:hypothetical protein
VNAPITITATLKAWVTSCRSVDEVLNAVKEGKHTDAADAMCFYSGDMAKGVSPWTLIGEADVTVRLHSRDQLVSNQLASLQAELAEARAEWLTKQQQLLDRISKLQALTNEVEA